MTGGGFGGCAVAFVHRPVIDAFVSEVIGRYRSEGDNEPMAYLSGAAKAATIVAI
jgi:galactokinase